MRFGDVLNGSNAFRKVIAKIDNNEFPVKITGVCESANGHVISSIASASRALVICYTDMEAAELYKDLTFYSENVYRFPTKELVYYNVDAVGRESENRRIRALFNWSKGGILVSSVDAIMQYTMPRNHFDSDRLELKIGDIYNLEDLSQKLVAMGYNRAPEVDGVGLFSVRGGIVDIFSPNNRLPVRVEFFDDEVDSLRFFDWETQRSTENADEVTILPACEAVMDTDERKQLAETISGLCKEHPDDDSLASEMAKAEEGVYFPSVDKYVSSAYGKIPLLTDYIDGASVFVVDPKRIADRFKNFCHDKADLIAQLIERGAVYGSGSALFPDGSEIWNKLCGENVIFISSFDSDADSIEVKTRQTVSFHGKIEYLYDSLTEYQKRKKTVVILVQSNEKSENLLGVLKERGYDCRLGSGDDIEEGRINILIGSAKAGFEYPEIDFVLISDREIFEGTERRARRRAENTKRIKSYSEIQRGDYVVHQLHGIGVYDGIRQNTVNGITKDYLRVLYKDGDVLYVPVEQLDLLYKYSGSDGAKVKVNKLGGKEWSKTKQRVKKATDEMAKQLAQLYAQRERSKGFAFSKDTVWQRDFEDSFIYTETEDQLRSIEEVKHDMESERPMERLLCGDVGFGKTEVALRAAFKAVMDSKQVAYLCPTTILAMQHYDTFTERMSKFPIKVEMLSRFRTKAQQSKIIKKLKNGEIDVIIGTHRILQKDVKFKDLGLLIIDEEQRFGVAHKEKLKELKKNIDVLSMTATPIPRTLHMSMISVRDMSVLTRPPQNRYPIQTYVLENNPSIILDAVRLELSRGGQVFYLYNRIQGIYKKAQWLKDAFPDKVVRVGHGQMEENELEDIMHGMVTGETDILVCTTIIETGLDIPNANTIIIENADKMGLSQLYQLRGRVGRSNKKAYAYLTYQRDKIVSEEAAKRLQAIKEFTEFGSGFKIALKDLEIRGAGDILGAKQHGHMDAVGYDLYCKILKQSVSEETGEKFEEKAETLIDIAVDAYLPERYISDPAQRIDIYKKISLITDERDKMDVIDELTDRYGDVPKSAQQIVDVAVLKTRASGAGISELVQRDDFLTVKFSKVDLDKLIAIVSSSPLKYKLIAGDVPQLRIRLDNKQNVLEEASQFINLIS